MARGRRLLEDGEGKFSTGRFLSVLCGLCGAMVVVAGVAALFLKMPEAKFIVATGASLVGGSPLVKALQKFTENGRL